MEMNWRAIMRGEAREMYEQNPQNPQNYGEKPNIANFANIADRWNALKTDKTRLSSVLSVRDGGVLDEKPELLRQVRAACTGLSITPDQFMVLLNDQDKAAILDGEIPVVPTLRAYAKSFAGGIQSGRIKFHPTSGALLKHG
jgi:hypothetical protein